MPAARRTKKTTAKISDEECNQEVNLFTSSCSDSVSTRTTSPLPIVERTVEIMERVKSKIDSFDKPSQLQLLQMILRLYSSQKRTIDGPLDSVSQETFESFVSQITENQNGIFLNLTLCDDMLWNACVASVTAIERQANDLKMLDQEREKEVAKIKRQCKVKRLVSSAT